MSDFYSGPERRHAEDGERIAVLETDMAQLMDGQRKIIERLDRISDDLMKYRGFVHGVIWIVGGIGAGILAGWQFLKDHIK
jgi:hypothetical protein